MRGFSELGRRAVDDRTRLDQVGRIELVAAVVALVPARLGIAADRTRSLDVPVRQRVAGRGGKRAERRLLDETAVVVQRAEDVTCDVRMVSRRRPREAVIADAEIAEVLANQLVVSLGNLTRRDAFAIRRHHY